MTTRKSATKSRPQPRSAKKVGPVPAARGHKPRAKAPAAPKAAVSRPRAAKAAVVPKRATRGQQAVAMLSRKQGVALDELMAEFGVQKHSARALVSVFGRKAGGVERREGRYYLKG